MILRDYQCKTCGMAFEHADPGRTVQDLDSYTFGKVDPPSPACIFCGEKTKRLMSAPMLKDVG